jgi:hypothetical protein
MPTFTFIAEASNGAIIHEGTIAAATHREAHAAFWRSLTDAQRDACACLECLDVVPASHRKLMD